MFTRIFYLFLLAANEEMMKALAEDADENVNIVLVKESEKKQEKDNFKWLGLGNDVNTEGNNMPKQFVKKEDCSTKVLKQCQAKEVETNQPETSKETEKKMTENTTVENGIPIKAKSVR